MVAPSSPLYADFLDLAYRPDLHLLTVRWLRAVTLAELQLGFRAAQERGRRHQVRRWLVDVRRRTELEASASAWVATALLPAVAAETSPATLHVAYLLSPTRADILRTDPAMRATTAAAQAPTQPYRLQTFLDEGQAVQWLLDQTA